MKKFAQLPGASLAVGAFVLTILLGFGGASASALWQQTSTANMTVTADGNWGPAFSLTCRNNASDKEATLTVTLPGTPLTLAPATVSYAAVQANGTTGTSYAALPIAATVTPGSIVLKETSPIIVASGSASTLTVRVTVVYLDQKQASADWALRLDHSNGKIYCN